MIQKNQTSSLHILGADISSLKKSEDFGGVYAYEDGTEANALKILKDHGLMTDDEFNREIDSLKILPGDEKWTSKP